jgi:hypothetical protein
VGPKYKHGVKCGLHVPMELNRNTFSNWVNFILECIIRGKKRHLHGRGGKREYTKKTKKTEFTFFFFLPETSKFYSSAIWLYSANTNSEAQ